MPLNTTEKQFESDIAAALLSPAGGYTRNGDCYDPKLGLFVDTLIRFVQKTQPNEWAFFEKQNPVNPVRKFCAAFNNACDADGLLSVLRHGFKHRGRRFRVLSSMMDLGPWRKPSSESYMVATLPAVNSRVFRADS